MKPFEDETLYPFAERSSGENKGFFFFTHLWDT